MKKLMAIPQTYIEDSMKMITTDLDVILIQDSTMREYHGANASNTKKFCQYFI